MFAKANWEELIVISEMPSGFGKEKSDILKYKVRKWNCTFFEFYYLSYLWSCKVVVFKAEKA